MATSMTQRDIVRVLQSIVSILNSSGDTRWLSAIERQVSRFRAAQPGTDEYRDAVRDALRMFGGMGSFQDLVLQNATGVLPEQRELDRAGHDLFAALRSELT